MNPEQQPINYDKPVAYDANGQPLYAHPPAEEPKEELDAQAVRIIRPADPDKLVVSDAAKMKHNRSKQLYPNLNLSEGEYVITSVHRHQIGLFLPLFIAVLLISLSFTLLFNFDWIVQSIPVKSIAINPSLVVFPVIIFITLVILSTYIVYSVYNNNKFYLTNESVVQEIQTSIFSKKEQTVSLADIEDVSFSQTGIIQQIFNFGSIRLSTEGDETTYRFSFVANPKATIAILNNAVEAFKNGRPVDQ